MIGVDVDVYVYVYVAMPTMKPLIKVMDKAGVKRFIAMSVSDI
ncbi:hypothetical protein [Limosilactobacillus sp.]|nr:hypothetical protein [Limosilactobacillus sp.]